MDAKDISMQKIIGSFLRAWPAWLLFMAHLIIFILLGTISVLVLIPLTLLIISSALLFSSIGVMFSSICKRSSTSSTLNTLILLFFTIPICCMPLFLGSPLFVAFVILFNWAGFNGGDNSMDFPFPPVSENGFWGLLFSPYFFIIYVIVYLLLMCAAYAISVKKIRLRIM
jgi:hypothetical protein